MARPTKQGIDYFPVDVNFDDKIELLIADKGAVALAVLVTLWQLIYQNEGYYIKANNDLHLLIKRRIMTDSETIKDVLTGLIDRQIFDKDQFLAHGIYTSKAIQKRYFEAAKKKKEVSVVKNYLCMGIDSGINAVYSSGNATNVEVEVDIKEDVAVENTVFNAWNLMAEKHGFPKLRAMTAERKKKAKDRKFLEHAEEIEKALGEVGQFVKDSTWLKFDWIVKSDTNLMKLLEGTYKDKANYKQPPPKPQPEKPKTVTTPPDPVWVCPDFTPEEIAENNRLIALEEEKKRGGW
jgi:hypothetical protein